MKRQYKKVDALTIDGVKLRAGSMVEFLLIGSKRPMDNGIYTVTVGKVRRAKKSRRESGREDEMTPDQQARLRELSDRAKRDGWRKQPFADIGETFQLYRSADANGVLSDVRRDLHRRYESETSRWQPWRRKGAV